MLKQHLLQCGVIFEAIESETMIYTSNNGAYQFKDVVLNARANFTSDDRNEFSKKTMKCKNYQNWH